MPLSLLFVSFSPLPNSIIALPIVMLRFQSHQTLSSNFSSSSNPRRNGHFSVHRRRFQKVDFSSRRASWKSSLEGYDEGNHFFQAKLLVSETIRHYNLRKQGFLDESNWGMTVQSQSFRSNLSGFQSGSIGYGLLQRFHSPTIFLKIACEGDLLLPIVVGEFAIENLIDSLKGERKEGCPNQLQFMKNLIGTLGYEVKKVLITKRVINTYFAQIFLGKMTEVANISIDSRPSDAVHVANGFKAPIYVSKDIVSRDAIRIVYGSRTRDTTKTIYDVTLDSATEGPDLLAEELDLVMKMNEAVMAERFKEAAFWRNKLKRLRMPRDEM